MITIVNAIIIKNNKFLTVKRNEEPWKGMYGLPGGHSKDNEGNLEALKREIKEETGFEIGVKESDFIGITKLEYQSKVFEVNFYKAKIIGGKENLQKEEVQEIKYFSLDEFKNNLKNYDLSSNGIISISNILKLAGCH